MRLTIQGDERGVSLNFDAAEWDKFSDAGFRNLWRAIVEAVEVGPKRQGEMATWQIIPKTPPER